MSVDIVAIFAFVPKISSLLFSFLNKIQISFWRPSFNHSSCACGRITPYSAFCFPAHSWGFNSGHVILVALVIKNPPAKAEDTRDVVSIPGSGRSPGVKNGNPLQYSCLNIPWTEEPGGLVHGVAKSQTQLSMCYSSSSSS